MRLLNNFTNFLRARLVKERVANLDTYDVISISIDHQTYRNTLQSLLERECHSSCDDKTVNLYLSETSSRKETRNSYLVQHVLNELNFIRYLGATKDCKERTLWVVQGL